MAFRYWSEAAQTRHPQALSLIATLYFESYLVAHELEKAFELYQHALQSDPDHGFSQMGVALCYLNGVG